MTPLAPYHFKHFQADHSVFVADVISTKGRRKAALDKIARSTNRDKRRLLIRQFLNDPALKLLYFFESVQAKRLLKQFPPERMQHAAEQLSTSHHCYEGVYPKNLPNGSSGKIRTTYNFGPGKHALQRMVADILRAMFPLPSDSHFTIQGGVQAALKAVEGHVREGFIYGVERDIAQFYPSVNVVELARLLRPLPFSVVMNVIAYAPGFVWYGSHVLPDAVHDAPLPLRGLLAQGSAASPIAAEVLMADLLQGLPDDVRVISYADNVLILGETLDSVEAANAALEARAREHPCGPLGLKPSASIKNFAEEAITFLGNDGEWNGQGMHWRPNTFAMEKIYTAVETARNSDEVLKAEKWLRNWRRGYSLWNNGDEEVSLLIAQLGARLAFNSTSSRITGYRTGLMLVIDYCNRVRRNTGAFPSLHEILPDHWNNSTPDRRRLFIEAIERRLGIQRQPSSNDG